MLNLALNFTLSLVLVALCPTLCLMSCSGGVVQRIDDPKSLPPAPPRRGFLRLPDGPPETMIYVNGTFKGRFSDYPRRAMLLPSGALRVRLSAPGHVTIYAEIEISPRRPVELTGKLMPISQ